ncbi:MAG TPA: hypothetical protein VF623_07660 [Segetibacter sp.]|jgi:hypothetical protein
MKFFCHITVSDINHARITFTVMQLSKHVFEAYPVQNDLPCTFPLYSKVFLTKKEDLWEHQFEYNDKWIEQDCIQQILKKLDNKLNTLKTVSGLKQ